MTSPVFVHFDERADADEFMAAAADRGLVPRLHRDMFAGEDDLDDAAWVVEVDGEVADLAEHAGGWLSAGPAGSSPTTLPDLPAAPKRIKRQQ